MNSLKCKKLKSAVTINNEKTICIFCGFSYADSCKSKTTHFKRHVIGRNCKSDCKEKMESRLIFLKELKELEQNDNDYDFDLLHEDDSDDELQSDKPAKKKNKQDVSPMSEEVIKRFHDSFSDFIFSNGLPLSIIESKKLIKSLKILCPSITLASRKKLSEEILDKQFNDQQTKFKLTLDRFNYQNKGIVGTIMLDSWTDVNRKGVVSFLYTTPLLPKPYLIKSICPGTYSVDGTYIALETIKVIKEIGESRVTSICTDNASNMVLAREKIKEVYPTINNIGCICHWISLIPKDLLKQNQKFKETINKASDIVNYILNHHVPNSLFEKKCKGKGLVTSNATRWFTHVYMLESLAQNHGILDECAREEAFLSKSVIQEQKEQYIPLAAEELKTVEKIKNLIVSDSDFWNGIHMIIQLFAPLRDIEKEFENLHPHLEVVYPKLINYKQYIANFNVNKQYDSMKQKLITIIDERFEFLQEVKIYKIAYYFDPISMGELITNEKMELVSEMSQWFIESRRINFQNQLASYNIAIARQAVSFKSALKEQCMLFHFYNIRSEFDMVAEYGIHIFSCIFSTSSVERHFSHFAYIQNRYRNRLTHSRATKLVALFENPIENGSALSLEDIDNEQDKSQEQQLEEEFIGNL